MGDNGDEIVIDPKSPFVLRALRARERSIDSPFRSGDVLRVFGLLDKPIELRVSKVSTNGEVIKGTSYNRNYELRKNEYVGWAVSLVTRGKELRLLANCVRLERIVG